MRAVFIFLLQQSGALPSYGRHFSLSCGLPTYPGAQLTTAETKKSNLTSWGFSPVYYFITIQRGCRVVSPFTVLAGVAGLAGRALVAAVSEALAGGRKPDTQTRC